MLGKLIKYEIKATSRTFLPLYGAVIILALVNKLFMALEGAKGGANYLNQLSGSSLALQRLSEIPATLAMTTYVIIIIALFVLTFIVMIQRFYKNLLGDEGYLMFTLPVAPWKNIVNKLLVSMMWTVLTGIVTALSIFIVAVNAEFLREFPRAMEEMFYFFKVELQMNAVVFFTQIAVTMFIGLVVGILQVYAAISIGQLVNSHKLLASFGAYIGINIVMQTVTSLIMAALTMFGLNDWMNVSTYNTMISSMAGLMDWMIVITNLISLAFGVLFYVLTQRILTKRLNLE